jgi:methyl-accepting chemotaxis protein
MKLGAKIGMGFGALIGIALLLGGLAIWNMLSVKTVTTVLSEQNVPEMGVATNVERSSLKTMYQTRGYAYTEEKAFLDAARKELADVKKYVDDAQSHADKYSLENLKKNADTAEKYALEYEQLLNETVKATEAMGKDKDAMNSAAGKYMEVCSVFLKDQSKKLEEEIQESRAQASTSTSPGAAGKTSNWEVKLNERAWKIAICNDVIDLGNAIRLGNWRAQCERNPQLFQEAQKKFEDVNKKLDELKTKTVQEANLKMIEECRMAGKAYNDAMTSFLTNWFSREDLGKKRNIAADAVLQAAQDTSEQGMKSTQAESNNAANSLGTASTTMIVGLSVGVVVGVLLAIFITRGITKPVNRIIEDLTSGADQVAAASGQVSSASQSAAQGASEQASSLEETSSALEEMSSMSKTNADNASKANDLMSQTTQVVGQSQNVMKQTSDAMAKINDASGKIANIIKVIEEIAFQTNLLALNAAVEAARAGEHGKGFAVVADEVRNLAQRSAQAANETAQLISDTIERVKKGNELNDELGESFGKVNEASMKVAQLVEQIATASADQAKGVDQINAAMGQMDKVVQQSAAGAEESASASEELSSQAQVLRQTVDQLSSLVGGDHSQGRAVNTHYKKAASPSRSHPQIQASSSSSVGTFKKESGTQVRDF